MFLANNVRGVRREMKLRALLEKVDTPQCVIIIKDLEIQWYQIFKSPGLLNQEVEKIITDGEIHVCEDDKLVYYKPILKIFIKEK